MCNYIMCEAHFLLFFPMYTNDVINSENVYVENISSSNLMNSTRIQNGETRFSVLQTNELDSHILESCTWFN